MSDVSVPRFRAATEETPVARTLLIAIAFGGIAVQVFAPLIAVFAEALQKGWLAAVASLGWRWSRCC